MQARITRRSRIGFYNPCGVAVEAELVCCVGGNPDDQSPLQHFMSKRMGAKKIEVKASHVSFISQPERITNLILEAAGQK
jgi:hypothetical protein